MDEPSSDHSLLPGRRDLGRLREATAVAHDAVLRARGGPGVNAELVRARAAYLAALDDYVRALNHHGLPVPGRLRDDLRLLRGLS